MNCREALERLDEFMDGELPAALAAELESHLGSCPSCRSEADTLRSLISCAESLPRSMEPPTDLWPGIKARLKAERSDRSALPFPAFPAPRPRKCVALPYAAAAALVLGIAGSLAG